MNVDLQSLDPSSSLAADQPRHSSRVRDKSSCHASQGLPCRRRAELLTHTCSLSLSCPGEKAVRAKKTPRVAEKVISSVSTHGNMLSFPPNYPNTVAPVKYSVPSYRLVENLTLNLGKSHCAVCSCHSVPVLGLIHLEVPLSIASPHRITRAVLVGFFFTAKDWNPFWWNDARSEYCQPIRNCTVIYTCRGDWLLCIKWGELNDLKIYLQKGSSRRQDAFLAFLYWKSNHLVLRDLPSIWTYLLF